MTRQQQRKAAGLCIECGNPVGPERFGFNRCVSCAEKAKERARKLHQQRKDARLCLRCGKTAISGMTLCNSCAKENEEKNKEKDNRRKAGGLCPRCGKSVKSGKIHCKSCLEKEREQDKQRVTAGLCMSCGGNTPALPNRIRCRTCTIKYVVKHNCKSIKLAKSLDMKLTNQLFRCPYTGIGLTIGENASIDHKVARANGGTNDLDNLEWVHRWRNRMKSDMGKDEFAEQLDQFLIETVKCRFGVDIKQGIKQ